MLSTKRHLRQADLGLLVQVMIQMLKPRRTAHVDLHKSTIEKLKQNMYAADLSYTSSCPLAQGLHDQWRELDNG